VAACESADVAHELLTADEPGERFPGYDLPPGYRALYQPDGGFLAVERCTVAHVGAAHDAGATIRAREPVLAIEETGDGVDVRTEKGRYEADELLVTAGAWCRELLPALSSAVVPVRAVMAWFRPERPEWFTPDRVPVFLLRGEDESGYGFPRFERPGVKVGLSDPTPAVDPGEMDPEPTAAEERLHRRLVRRHFPAAAGPTMRLATCLWTTTDDEDFLLGRPERYDSLTAGAGFSGHGFRFASALGEILADLVSPARRNTTSGSST
jgi:sarcosine oxidase